MTPDELLEEVISRFDILLADEPDMLETQLKQALRTYQDKAGFIRTVKYSEALGGVIEYPADYLQLVGIVDGNGETLLIDLLEDGIHINMMPPFGRRRGSPPPFTLSYLINFRKADTASFQVPETAAGLIMDYLECLIQIKNVPRLHRHAISSKVDVSYLPDEATLYGRKVDLENDMSSQKAIIGGASIYG